MNLHRIPSTFSLTRHATRQIEDKGFDALTVLRVAADPDISYESSKHPGQWKHIGDDLCVVVDPESKRVITVFLNVERTPLRPDQMVQENPLDA